MTSNNRGTFDLPDEIELTTWGRIVRWITLHLRIVRLASLVVGLAVFIVFVPAYIRTVFWNGIKSNPLLMGMLVVFSILSISLVWSTGQRIDAWGFLFLNLRGPRPSWLDQVMVGLTQAGSGVVALGIALGFFISGDRLIAYEIMLGTVSLWLIVEILKFLIYRSRPFIRLTQARIVGFRAIGRSFPSGHTSQVFFLATLIAQHFHPAAWIVFLLYAVALLVGITRMYVGAHYPRDVLAGAILGSAWGLLGAIIEGYVFNRNGLGG